MNAPGIDPCAKLVQPRKYVYLIIMDIIIIFIIIIIIIIYIYIWCSKAIQTYTWSIFTIHSEAETVSYYSHARMTCEAAGAQLARIPAGCSTIKEINHKSSNSNNKITSSLMVIDKNLNLKTLLNQVHCKSRFQFWITPKRSIFAAFNTFINLK